MKRWTGLVLVACVAGVVLAQWVAPAMMQSVVIMLLLALVALIVFTRRDALNETVGSLTDSRYSRAQLPPRGRALGAARPR